MNPTFSLETEFFSNSNAWGKIRARYKKNKSIDPLIENLKGKETEHAAQIRLYLEILTLANLLNKDASEDANFVEKVELYLKEFRYQYEESEVIAMFEKIDRNGVILDKSQNRAEIPYIFLLLKPAVVERLAKAYPAFIFKYNILTVFENDMSTDFIDIEEQAELFLKLKQYVYAKVFAQYNLAQAEANADAFGTDDSSIINHLKSAETLCKRIEKQL